MNRRTFLGTLGLTAGIEALTFSSIDNQVEKEVVKIKNEMLAGYKIGYISDIHISGATTPKFVEDALRLLDCDLLILGGDYTWIPEQGGRRFFHLGTDEFLKFSWEEMPQVLHTRLLEILDTYAPRDGILAIMGNHDRRFGDSVCVDTLTRSEKIKFLINDSTTLPNGLSVVGVDDYLTGFPKMPKINENSILVAHNPDYISGLNGLSSFLFCLSGHTHGGQIQAPFIGPLALNVLDTRFTEGWVEHTGVKVLVSRGLGTVGIPLRINCKAQVHQIEFV